MAARNSLGAGEADSGRIRKVVDDQITVRKRDGTIGSMNGAWAFLLRAMLMISLPFYGWLAWEALESRDFRKTTSQQIQFQREFFDQQQMWFKTQVDTMTRKIEANEQRISSIQADVAVVKATLLRDLQEK